MSSKTAQTGAVKITLHSANNDVDEKAEVTVALKNPEERFPPESVMTIQASGNNGATASTSGNSSRHTSGSSNEHRRHHASRQFSESSTGRNRHHINRHSASRKNRDADTSSPAAATRLPSEAGSVMSRGQSHTPSGNGTGRRSKSRSAGKDNGYPFVGYPVHPGYPPMNYMGENGMIGAWPPMLLPAYAQPVSGQQMSSASPASRTGVQGYSDAHQGFAPDGQYRMHNAGTSQSSQMREAGQSGQHMVYSALDRQGGPTVGPDGLYRTGQITPGGQVLGSDGLYRTGQITPGGQVLGSDGLYRTGQITPGGQVLGSDGLYRTGQTTQVGPHGDYRTYTALDTQGSLQHGYGPNGEQKYSGVTVQGQELQHGFGEYVETLPDGSRVRYVEVEVNEERIVEVPRVEVREVIREVKVPQYQTREVEVEDLQIDEVVTYKEKIVEEEHEVRKPVKVVKEVPVETVVEKKVDVHTTREEVIEIPEVVHVEKPYTVEQAVHVPHYVQKEVPCMVAQKLRPNLRSSGRMKVPTTTFEPVLYAVDVYIPKPVSNAVITGEKIDETHQRVDVPAPQYNSLVYKLNPELDQKHVNEVCLRSAEGHVPLLPAGELVEIVPPFRGAWRSDISNSAPAQKRKTHRRRHHQDHNRHGKH